MKTKAQNNRYKYFISAATLAGMLLAQVGGSITANAAQIKVNYGDNLSSLALKNNTSVDQLVKTNHIANSNQIQVGQVLNVDDAQTLTKIITVKAGDTVSSLAKTYGTTITQIAKDNNLDNNYTIIVGQQLKINPDDGNNNQSTTNVNSNNETTSQQFANNYNQSASTTGAQQTQSISNQANSSNNYTSSVTGNDAAAKAWIASRESGGSYTARNGQFIGKYQLSSSYLGGDYSPANQEKVADQYVQGRYGSWTAAQQFWQSHGWY